MLAAPDVGWMDGFICFVASCWLAVVVLFFIFSKIFLHFSRDVMVPCLFPTTVFFLFSLSVANSPVSDVWPDCTRAVFVRQLTQKMVRMEN